MEPIRSEDEARREKVISPFSQSEAVIASERKTLSKMVVLVVCCAALIITGLVVGIFVTRYLNDPYRTLESFPVSKYFDNYQSLAGSKFKAELRVEADLGWKDGAGRLMLFSTADDPRPLAVLIPVAVAKGIYFTKGQTYLIQAEVKEGGLIYADSCEKN